MPAGTADFVPKVKGFKFSLSGVIQSSIYIQPSPDIKGYNNAMTLSKYFTIFLFISFLSLSLHASAKNDDLKPKSPDESSAILLVAQTLNYLDKNPSIWPGFNIDEMPIIIHFDSNPHYYAFNFTPKDQTIPWRKTTLNNRLVYVLDFDALQVKELSADYQVINGQMSYIYEIYNYDDNSEVLYSLRALIDKRFAYYWAKESKVPERAYAYWKYVTNAFNNIDDVEYVYIEDAILKKYLLTRDTEELKNYLAVHDYRMKQLSKEEAERDNALEIRFAPGAYVSFQGLNLSKEDYLNQVLDNYTNRFYCPALTNAQDILYCITFGHYNLVGPVLGVALNQVAGKGWQSKIISGPLSFSELLKTFFPMNESEMKVRLEKSEEDFGLSDMEKQLNKNFTTYLTNMKKQQSLYDDMPGVELIIDNRYCDLKKFIRRYDQEFVISTETNLYINMREDMACETDETVIKIVYKNMPFVYQESSVLKNQVKLAPGSVMTIDGKTKTVDEWIAKDMRLDFQVLQLDGATASISVQGFGRMEIKKGQIRIFAPPSE